MLTLEEKQQTKPHILNPFRGRTMGLGCVSLTYKNAGIVDFAIQNGVTVFDTADCYLDGQSELALGERLQNYERERLFICSKVGVQFLKNKVSLNGNPDYIQSAVLASLKRLGTTYIDLYYLHRVDPKVSLEDSVRALKELVDSGKINFIGLSEVDADEIRRAHAIHPITAVQIEFSPWSSHDQKNGVIASCQELGIAVVAYSPLGRGFFTKLGKDFFEGCAPTDFRSSLPRYHDENLNQNLRMRERIETLALTKGCTVAQFVLAWEMQQGLVTIPATTNKKHLLENLGALDIMFSERDMQYFNNVVSSLDFAGPRYPLDPEISGIHRSPENEQMPDGKGLTRRLTFGSTMDMKDASLLGALGIYGRGYHRRGSSGDAAKIQVDLTPRSKLLRSNSESDLA